MFTIILYDFGMILLELTRTDAVFSRTTMVLFCVEIKVLGMGWKFTVIFYGPKETPEAPELGQEVTEEVTSLGAPP